MPRHRRKRTVYLAAFLVAVLCRAIAAGSDTALLKTEPRAAGTAISSTTDTAHAASAVGASTRQSPVSGRIGAPVPPAVAAPRQALRPGLKTLLARTVEVTRGIAVKALIVIASLCMIATTVLFLLRQADHGRFMTNTRLSIMDKEVQRACRYVEKNYRDPGLSLESICASLVTGPAFLQALFERELGMTVEEFIAQVRINRAREALRRAPGASPADLAREAGFSDEKTFTSVFQRIVGTRVEEYRTSLS